MKKILLVCAVSAALSGVVMAQDANQSVADLLNHNGIYTNLQLGYGWTGYNSTDLNIRGFDISKSGFSGRIDVGYNFNEYFGAEIGYLYLPKIEFKNINGYGINLSFRQTVFDLLAKGTLPLVNNFDAFVKGGLAWVHRGSVEASGYGVTISGSGSDNKAVPVLGIGSSYHFTENLTADISYLHYFQNGDLKSVDFVALGIGWQF